MFQLLSEVIALYVERARDTEYHKLANDVFKRLFDAVSDKTVADLNMSVEQLEGYDHVVIAHTTFKSLGVDVPSVPDGFSFAVAVESIKRGYEVKTFSDGMTLESGRIKAMPMGGIILGIATQETAKTWPIDTSASLVTQRATKRLNTGSKP